MAKRLLVFLVIALFVCCGAACSAKSVQVVATGAPGIPTEIVDHLKTATGDFFTKRGYTVVQTGADYTVQTNVDSAESDKKFSPLGCLACGIWGAVKAKSKATVSTRVMDADGKQLFVNTGSGAGEGSDIGGIFSGANGPKKQAISNALKELYSAFLIQQNNPK